MKVPLVDLTAQYRTIKVEIDEAIRRVLESGHFILDEEVKAFEQEMAAYCGVRFAIGVASGTDALRLALLACGIGPGDEVITTAFTFVATAETIVQCGAIPVFVDIDLKSYSIDLGKIEQKVTSKTKAILPVHLYGHPADIDLLRQIAIKYGLRVIEDCAQALGAEYKGTKVGSVGDAGCLSFFPTKNIGAFGDAGMVITNQPEIAEKVRLLRSHGAKRSYYYVLPGFNSRLDSLQAAILRVKLRRIDSWNELRRARAALYSRLLSEVPDIVTPFIAPGVRHSMNCYTIRLKDADPNREKLIKYLEANSIQTKVYYPLCLHLQEAYKYLGYRPGDLPEGERAQNEVLSLPMYPELDDEQIHYVVQNIEAFVESA